MDSEQKGLLEDLILEMMEFNQGMVSIDKKISLSNDYLNDINSNSWATFEQLHTIAKILSGNKLEDMENSREQNELNKKVLNALQGIESNTKEKKSARELDVNITSLGNIAAMVTGAVVGYVKQFAAAMKGLWLLNSHIFSRIGKFVRGEFELIRDAIKSSKWLGHFKDIFGSMRNKVVSFIAGLSMQFDLLKDSMKGGKVSKALAWIKVTWENMTKNVSFIGEVLGKVYKATEPLRSAVSSFGNFLKRVAFIFFDVDDLMKDGSSILKFFGDKVKGVFDKIKSFFGSGADTLLGKVGRFLGKLGWFMTIWDVLTGMWDGFQQDGIMGAIIGGVKGFFKGFAQLGNLLKDLVSWISEKLGFENFSAMLDSFDFVALINNTIDGVVGWFKTIFTDPTAALSTLWNNMVGEGGLMDLMLKPISMLIDWVTKKLAFRSEDAPDFNLGNVIRTVWNTIIDWVASIVEKIPVVGSVGAEKVRGLKAETATVNMSEMATKPNTPASAEQVTVEKARTPDSKQVPVPMKVASNSGDTLNTAASQNKSAQVYAEAARDSAIIAGVGNTNVESGGGRTSINTANSVSTVNISHSSLPDRTDWSVMSGNFGLAP